MNRWIYRGFREILTAIFREICYPVITTSSELQSVTDRFLLVRTGFRNIKDMFWKWKIDSEPPQTRKISSEMNPDTMWWQEVFRRQLDVSPFGDLSIWSDAPTRQCNAFRNQNSGSTCVCPLFGWMSINSLLSHGSSLSSRQLSSLHFIRRNCHWKRLYYHRRRFICSK